MSDEFKRAVDAVFDRRSGVLKRLADADLARDWTVLPTAELASLKAQLEQVTREHKGLIYQIEMRGGAHGHIYEGSDCLLCGHFGPADEPEPCDAEKRFAQLRAQLEAAHAGAAALRSAAEAVMEEHDEETTGSARLDHLINLAMDQRSAGRNYVKREVVEKVAEALEAIALRAQTGFLTGTYEARGRTLESIEEQTRAALALLQERP
jgi:hypothetical protein